ncbi:MAG: c-type cytochrome, partial [Deltaproteobacteria bacterium]|nr:c-type cytochrome [Deltaproteobacteria bacterium]
YYRVALSRARNEAQREWARSQRVEIQQLQLKERGTVERCVTCHVAYDNPMFRDYSEPLRTHSSLVESHPPKRFGCTSCHGGEGRAVTTLEAHGQGEVVAKPLVKGEYAQAACYGCHGLNTLPPQATAAVVRGQNLVNRYFCLACHKINGEGGEEGPDLSAAGSDRSWLWLYAHTARPQGVVAGSTMPIFSLTRDEIRDVAIYLMTLLDGRDQLKNLPLRARRAAKDHASEKPAQGAIRGEPDSGAGGDGIEFKYRGRELFQGAGCSLCHSIGITGGEVGPALTHIGRIPGARCPSSI